MAKEAYYFSHDANARHDPKILAMRSVYGSEGYGWYWMIIELLREQQDYKIKINKYVWDAIAMQTQCERNAAQKFVQDCINEFDLLISDDQYLWSESLLMRMANKNEKSEKARQSAKKRWDNEHSKPSGDRGLMHSESERNAIAMQTQCERNANAMQLKESKRKEIYIAQFDQLWDLYPSKKGKKKALAKWISYGDSIDFEKVIEGTKKYIAYCSAKDRPFQDGSTFVNNQSWNDDWSLSTKTQLFTDKRKEFLDAQKEARERFEREREVKK